MGQLPGSAINWNQPPGLVFGLKHSSNQADKRFTWNAGLYDPASSMQVPGSLVRQNGGDRDGDEGEGYYWYETPGEWTDEILNWDRLPPGLVVGLKHSGNQPDKSLTLVSSYSLRGDQEHVGIAFYDPANPSDSYPGLVRHNGGDRGAPFGVGFYWYEAIGQGFSAWNAPLPGGLVFGLKHSVNQPGKSFLWNGYAYDPSQRGGPVPSGFVRCHGGDLGASNGEGYYWFESVGQGESQQNHLGSSCGI